MKKVGSDVDRSCLKAFGLFLVFLFMKTNQAVSETLMQKNIVRSKEIYGPCASCHGDEGQGGKMGEYPRLAGQKPAYMEKQILAFRNKIRVNLPMYPYTQERELSDQDISDVTNYLSSIELPTIMPVFKDNMDAVERLNAAARVMIVPRVPGNTENGKAIFAKECADCHGEKAQGEGSFPMLVGQYPNYLQRQVAAFIKGERPHDDKTPGSKGVLATLKESDIQDILSWLTAIQHDK